MFYFSTSTIRKNNIVDLLENPNTNVLKIEFRQKCYDQYTHPKILLRLKQNNDADEKIGNYPLAKKIDKVMFPN